MSPSSAVTSVTRLFDGFLKIDEYQVEMQTHAGAVVTVTRLVMERGDAVAVLAYDPDRDAVVLADEMRPGMLPRVEHPFDDALVAGAIGPGEDPIAAAVREVREEVNLELREPAIIHPGCYVSPGGTSERIVLVFGFADTSRAGGVHGNPHELEDIRTVVVSAEEFIARARRGAITDMKTMLAAYWLAEYRASIAPG